MKIFKWYKRWQQKNMHGAISQWGAEVRVMSNRGGGRVGG